MNHRSANECARGSCLVLAIAACLLLAAGGAPAASTTKEPPAPAASGPAVAAAPPAIEDQSWPDDRYISWGLASYDHDWTSREIGHAADRLASLSATHPGQLPRFASDRSGKTFARLATSVDAKFFRAKSLSLAVRLPAVLEYMEASSLLLKVYTSAFVAKQVGGAELIELFGAELRNSVIVFELIDELLATLSKDDPGYEARMAGLDEMRGGLAEVVSGAMTSLTEEQVYSTGVRMKLLGYCRETFPSLVPRLTAPSREEFRQRLDELVADPKLTELRPQLLLLRDAVRAAATPDGRP